MAHDLSPESAACSGFWESGRRTLPNRRQIWKWAEDDVANAIETADCLVWKTELTVAEDAFFPRDTHAKVGGDSSGEWGSEVSTECPP